MKKTRTAMSWIVAACLASACKTSPDIGPTSTAATGVTENPTPASLASTNHLPLDLPNVAIQTAHDPVTPPSATEAKDEGKKPDVIYVPTPQPVVDKMLELARVKRGDLVYDLGCGDGRIVVTAAKRYGARAVGFDVDPQRIAEARENVQSNGVEHLVTIEQKDIFTLDLRPANVVTLYLLPRLNVRLIPQLDRMKPGSRVVSHDFDIEGVVPVQTMAVRPDNDNIAHSIFLFEVPLKKEP
jgi:SAM-dependent methyltransferase